MYSENEGKTKLDWMYKGANSTVDREEYLLGRKIDKSLEQLNDDEKHKELGIVQPKNHVEHECIPPSIRDYKLQVGEQVDLATKLQEDPLVVIRKREEESRRQFLQNPILLKKLQATLLKRSRKKKKKSGRREGASEEDIDLKIAEKLSLLKGGSFKVDDDDDDDESEDLDLILLHKLAKLKNKLSHDEIEQVLECTKVAPSEDGDSSGDDYRGRPRMKNPGRKWRGGSPERDQRIKFRDGQNSLRNDNNQRRRMTDEEKERMRREMMENASWRDKERSRNVKRYREEDAKETKSTGKYDADFIHKELLKSANSSSVESRIKSNINSIQRGGNDMNTHFSRRH